MEETPISLIFIESIYSWIPDQSDPAVFTGRDSLEAEYILKFKKVMGYPLKFQDPEVSQ